MTSHANPVPTVPYQVGDDHRVLPRGRRRGERPDIAYLLRGGELGDVLVAFLEAGGNKSLAAARCGLSRPALYHRLDRISRIMGVDLESVESRVSLHVAMMSLRSMRTTAPGSR